MSVSKKLAIAGLVTLVLATGAVFWFSPRGPALTAFGDIAPLVLMIVATVAMLRNAVSQRRARAFWLLLGLGCLMWTVNQWFWTYYEVIVSRDLPEPFFGDIILFVHIVPFMAAVALRPHRTVKDRKVLLDTVNFLMLLVWWLFLYLFVIFPDEYVTLNVPVYSGHYDILYLIENLVLVFVLGMVASSTRGSWRKIYWNLFVACALYTLASEIIDVAITRKQYYTGSPFDLLLLLAIGWMGWTAILARGVAGATIQGNENVFPDGVRAQK